MTNLEKICTAVIDVPALVVETQRGTICAQADLLSKGIEEAPKSWNLRIEACIALAEVE